MNARQAKKIIRGGREALGLLLTPGHGPVNSGSAYYRESTRSEAERVYYRRAEHARAARPVGERTR